MDEARAQLESAGVVNSSAEAGWLLEAAAGRSRETLVRDDPEIDAPAVERFRSLVDRRTSGEPLQYVTGIAGFRHLDLMVGPGVFIPRPETELVAERAMARLPRGGVIVDAGTGSGAIALAIAGERPDARVWATEVSPEAFAWAAKNRAALDLQVELLQGDLLQPLPGDLAGRLDVVVGNMPYVPPEEAALLPTDVVAHEPEIALFGAAGGLALVERLAREARRWLRPGGWLVLEIGDGQGTRTTSLLERLGYADVAVRDDYTGRERIAEARLALDAA